MAHYDCNNCGARMGVAFGSCESCTPKEYFDIKKQMSQKRKELETKYKSCTLHEILELHNLYNIPTFTTVHDVIQQVVEIQLQPLKNSLEKIEKEHMR